MKRMGLGRSCCFASRFGLLVVLALAAGCGGQGKVTGRVLYDGQPLPGGRVTFRPADDRQNTVTALIDENGNYEAQLPVGQVRIAVDNRELERPADRVPQAPALPPGLKVPAVPNAPPGAPAAPPPREGAPPARPGRYVEIPERFYDVDSSGLTYTVTRGEQSHDIDLK